MKRITYIITLFVCTLSITNAQQKTVLLDSYFNNEHKKDASGKMISYHYKWEDKSNDGFSTFGQIFAGHDVKTTTLYDAPTAQNLKQADIYIIVDPDIPQENPNPKYIEPENIAAICDWVKAGGVLLVFNNDTTNAEFAHLNKLMQNFGIRFNADSRNHEQGDNFEQAAIYIKPGNEIFKEKKIYIKGISTLHVEPPAKAEMIDKDDIIVATAKYGKGTVFAVGDPWFYNEYTNGRLTFDFQNLQAANDLVKWAIEQIPRKKIRTL